MAKLMEGNLLFKRTDEVSTADSYVGEKGEVLLNYGGEYPEMRIHDGVTAGGHTVAALPYVYGQYNQPQIISPESGSEVGNSFVIESSGYAGIDALGNPIEHIASYWEIKSADGQAMWSSGRTETMLTSVNSVEINLALPSNLVVKVRVMYEAANGVISPWSDWVLFYSTLPAPEGPDGRTFAPVKDTVGIANNVLGYATITGINDYSSFVTTDDASKIFIGSHLATTRSEGPEDVEGTTRAWGNSGAIFVGVPDAESPDYVNAQALVLTRDDLPAWPIPNTSYSTPANGAVFDYCLNGIALAINADGTILASGMPEARIFSAQAGGVAIWEGEPGSMTCTQLIHPTQEDIGTQWCSIYDGYEARFGCSTAMSADGNHLIIGALFDRDITDLAYRGAWYHYIRQGGQYVFKNVYYNPGYNDPNVNLSNNSGYFAARICATPDASTVLVSAPYNYETYTHPELGNRTPYGIEYIYTYNETTGDYDLTQTLRGREIQSQAYDLGYISASHPFNGPFAQPANVLSYGYGGNRGKVISGDGKTLALTYSTHGALIFTRPDTVSDFVLTDFVDSYRANNGYSVINFEFDDMDLSYDGSRFVAATGYGVVAGGYEAGSIYFLRQGDRWEYADVVASKDMIDSELPVVTNAYSYVGLRGIKFIENGTGVAALDITGFRMDADDQGGGVVIIK